MRILKTSLARAMASPTTAAAAVRAPGSAGNEGSPKTAKGPPGSNMDDRAASATAVASWRLHSLKRVCEWCAGRCRKKLCTWGSWVVQLREQQKQWVAGQHPMPTGMRPPCCCGKQMAAAWTATAVLLKSRALLLVRIDRRGCRLVPQARARMLRDSINVRRNQDLSERAAAEAASTAAGPP